MDIFLHDYAGHPFQLALSEALARRGHSVTHAYFSGDKGPKGEFETVGANPSVRFMGIGIVGEYDKASFISRRFKDVEYGRNVAARISERRPDVVISGNTPTESQEHILQACRQAGIPFVSWVQDFYSLAATRILKRKLGPIGAAVGGYYRFLERRQFQRSAAVVLITDDFRNQASKWAGVTDKLFTIENWGALDDIHPGDKNNPWAERHGLLGKFVYLYSGTLALKHNPDLLARLARQWQDAPDVHVVVVAQGVGADWLEAAKRQDGLDNLTLLPLQPFSELEQVLATADVLVSVLEPDAGTFSVPSKVQSYLCAERPILLAAPAQNLATRVVAGRQAGLTVPPDEADAFLAAARRLHDDDALRRTLAANGRRYAEETFDIELVADKFERVFAYASEGKAKRDGTGT